MEQEIVSQLGSTQALTPVDALQGLFLTFIAVSDSFIFAQYLPDQVTNYVFSPIYFLMSLLYGGTIE